MGVERLFLPFSTSIKRHPELLIPKMELPPLRRFLHPLLPFSFLSPLLFHLLACDPGKEQQRSLESLVTARQHLADPKHFYGQEGDRQPQPHLDGRRWRDDLPNASSG